MSDTNLQDIFDNFDYVPNDYNDLESIAFAESLTSESVVGSIGSDNSALNYDIEMPFLFNNANFERARSRIEEDENNDIFLLKDINDIDTEVEVNTSTISIFDSESTTLGSTDGNEYFVMDTTNASESLSECPILDINNSSIQCCSSHSERQRPLSQLIGAWEINPEIFQKAQTKNDLSTI
ncbi:16304_t:CDS:1, partial [Funneliformis geosporum]